MSALRVHHAAPGSVLAILAGFLIQSRTARQAKAAAGSLAVSVVRDTDRAFSGRARFGALTDTALVVYLKAYEAFDRTITGMNINNAAERAADMLLCQASRW